MWTMLIKLNEENIKRIVENTVAKILKENEYFMSADSPEEFGFLWDELASAYEDNNSQGNDTVFCEVGFFAVNKMCNKNGKSFGENAKELCNKYYMNNDFRSAFNKIVNNVRFQRL